MEITSMVVPGFASLMARAASSAVCVVRVKYRRYPVTDQCSLNGIYSDFVCIWYLFCTYNNFHNMLLSLLQQVGCNNHLLNLGSSLVNGHNACVSVESLYLVVLDISVTAVDLYSALYASLLHIFRSIILCNRACDSRFL